MSSRNVEIAIARAIHEGYRRIAIDQGYEAPEVSWDELPVENRAIMANVVNSLILKNVIVPGKAVIS